MKNHRVVILIAILVLASLACRALNRGGANAPAPVPSDASESPASEEAPPSDSGSGDSGENSSASGFPITADAYNVVDVGDGSVIFYTKMSLDDVMKFYRNKYTSMGYAERGLLTVESDGVFSLVFDGDPSGKAVVIQGVDLGDGSGTVSIRLEDV
jgi:hypothetical protein